MERGSDDLEGVPSLSVMFFEHRRKKRGDEKWEAWPAGLRIMANRLNHLRIVGVAIDMPAVGAEAEPSHGQATLRRRSPESNFTLGRGWGVGRLTLPPPFLPQEKKSIISERKYMFCLFCLRFLFVLLVFRCSYVFVFVFL